MGAALRAEKRLEKAARNALTDPSDTSRPPGRHPDHRAYGQSLMRSALCVGKVSECDRSGEKTVSQRGH